MEGVEDGYDFTIARMYNDDSVPFNTTIKGSTDCPDMQLNFTTGDDGAAAYALSVKDKILFDITAVEPKETAEEEDKENVGDGDDEEDDDDDDEPDLKVYVGEGYFSNSMTEEEISQFVEFNKSEALECHITNEEDEYGKWWVFCFSYDDELRSKVSYGGWTVSDKNVHLDYDSCVYGGDDDDDDACWVVVKSGLNTHKKVDTAVTGTTASKPMFLEFRDADYEVEDEEIKSLRKLNTNDRVIIDVKRDTSSKPGDKTEIYINKLNLENEADREKIIIASANDGVRLEVTSDVKDADEDDDSYAISDNKIHSWVYTFTALGEAEDEDAIREKKLQESMSSNKACNPAEVTVGGSYKVSYNSYIPYFGKKIKKGKFKDLGITVTVDGVTYDAVKGKIVRLKGARETVSNASIVISKLDGGSDKKKRKAVEKALKKNTKPGKGSLGSIPVRIYAYRLDNDTLKELSDFTVSGKSGKNGVKFKYEGSKSSFKNGKKDSFGNEVKIEYDKAKTLVTISCNDIQGSASGSGIKDKTIE